MRNDKELISWVGNRKKARGTEKDRPRKEKTHIIVGIKREKKERKNKDEG